MKLSHRPRPLQQTERSQRDRGYILVKFALLLVPLLLMSGLSVDVGYWYSRIADIQKAADAAALAGVVWLPDFDKAEDYAVEAAARNGFDEALDDDIDVFVEPVGARQLRVTITDDRVSSFFFRNLGGSDIQLSRTGLAEYVLPVPMGSPRNYFGLGNLPTLGGPELIYQSVNPACTSKVNGDRHQSLHYGPLARNSRGELLASLSRCDDSATNDEYRDRGYELYIEAHKDRPADINVMLYDPRYNDAATSYQVPDGETCTTTTNYNPTTYTPAAPDFTDPDGTAEVILAGPAQYQTRSGSSGSYGSTQTLTWGQTITRRSDRIIYRVATTWTPSALGWTTSSSSSRVDVAGPAVYQLLDDGDWENPRFLNAGETIRPRANQVRYRTAALPTTRNCTPRNRTVEEPALDTERGDGENLESFTYTLYAADNTPLNDLDNPPVANCSKVYQRDTAFDVTTPSPYLGSVRWNNLCTITTGMPDGRYILRVHNDGAASSLGDDGSNQWGLVARYAGVSGDGLCDGRTDTMCPRVYGRDAISVYANTQSAIASFFLAEIEAEHNGKTLELELWDPGEGGDRIEFLRPNGAESWTPNQFSWVSFNADGTQAATGSNVNFVDVTGDKFNGRLLRIRIPLTDYAPPEDNQWWKIRYTFGGTRKVTDRTTWSARVIGDPVHLLEDEAP